MADSCVNHKHCATDAPGWLSGGHPALADGAVQRTVCFRGSSNCCSWLTDISVRNCGGFYVYQLKRPPYCNFRYCGSGISPTTGSKNKDLHDSTVFSGVQITPKTSTNISRYLYSTRLVCRFSSLTRARKEEKKWRTMSIIFANENAEFLPDFDLFEMNMFKNKKINIHYLP